VFCTGTRYSGDLSSGPPQAAKHYEIGAIDRTAVWHPQLHQHARRHGQEARTAVRAVIADFRVTT